MNRSKSWLALAVLSSYPVFAATFTADIASGLDSNPGTATSPFKTLSKCVSSLHAAGDVCELRAGTYDAGGVVNASGTASNPIVIQARSGEAVTIRQGVVPTWVNSGNNLWSTNFSYTELIAAQRANTNYYERGIMLWQDTARPLPEACFPNLTSNGTHPTLLSEAGTSNTVILNSQIPTGDLRGARAVAYPYLKQTAETRNILSSGTGQVSIGAGFYYMEPGKPFYLEGAKALIDQDWEWSWDAASGKIWIQMPAGVDPNLIKVRIQSSSTAFLLQAASNVVIRNLQFKGVVPVATQGSNGVQYERLTIQEPGILRFSDNVFDYTQLAGLVVRDQAKLTYSVIDGCNGRCLNVAGAGVVVENNFIRNGARIGLFEGIVSIQGSGAFISKNRIENSGRDGIAFMSQAVQNSIVRRNWILNCGLQAWDAAGVVVGAHPNGHVYIDSNLIMNVSNQGSGVFLDESSQNNHVDHNVIGGTMVGLTAQGNLAQNITTSNFNAIWNNSILPGTQAFVALRSVNDIYGTRFSNDITTAQPVVQTILPSSISSRVSSASEFVGWRSVWNGNLEPGIEPMLADVSKQNFTPLTGSPAIDIGLSGGWVFQGNNPDAGAVEYQTQQWVYGPYDPPVSNPTFGFEDLNKWNPPSWDNVAYTKALSNDRVEGNSSLAVTSGAFKVLESSAMTQADINGLGFVKWNMKVSTQQPNPYWLGQVQILITCPSLNMYSAWVGQVDLTGLAQGQWLEMVLPIPGAVASKLQGVKYSDLKVDITFNMPAGAGPLQFDNLRFLP